MTVEDHLLRLATQRPGQGPVDLMRLCLFDWAACAIAGQDEPVAQILAMQAGLEGEASVVGGGQTAAPDAALINGATGHALDYDDTHFDHIGHTSAVIMPAVLALAEDQMIPDMARVVQAALVGSEAAVRTGIWLGRDHYQVGFHQTATAGAIGAAVAGAQLLGLNADQAANAIGLSATGASGLKGQFGTMGKPLNAGLAARCGVETVLWAQSGLTGDRAGVTQFGATHHGVADMTAWDGSDWRIAGVSHKFHACCHGLHAMLEALRGLDGPVEALMVRTHPRWMSVCNKSTPTTGLEAKFSYAMTAAMTIHGIDTARIDSFADVMVRDPRLAGTRDCVSVVADDALTETQASIEVSYADGRAAVLTHDLAAPLDMETRQRRVQDKVTALLGDAAAPLWAACQGDDLAALTDILRG